MNTRTSLLSAAIVSCLAFHAHAQDATGTAQDLDTVQVVASAPAWKNRWIPSATT